MKMLVQEERGDFKQIKNNVTMHFYERISLLSFLQCVA